MVFRRGVFILSIFMGVTWFGCQTGKEEIATIARHGGITLEEFKTEFLKAKSKTEADTASMETKRLFLRGMIEDRLKLIAAKEANLETDSTVMAETKDRRQQVLIEGLFQKKIVDTVIKESMIRDFYNRSGKEITIRFIYLRYPSRTEADKEKTHVKADSLIREIKAGKSFSALAKVCSDDQASAMKGGLYGPMRYNDIGDPLEQKVFNMKEDEISGVIPSRSGDYIVRIEEVESVEQPPYEKEKENIVAKVSKQMNEPLMKKASAYLEDLRKKNKFQFNEPLLDTLVSMIKTIPDQDSLNLRITAMKDSVLFTCLNQTLTVGHYQKKINYLYDPRYAKVDKIKDLLDREIRTEMLAASAEEQHIDRIPSVQKRILAAIEAAMKRNIVIREVHQKVSYTDEDLKAWYDEKLSEKYMTREKVEIQEILVDDLKLANQLLKRIRAGEKFSALATKYTTRPGKKETSGRLAAFGRGSYGVIGEKAFELKVGEISDVIQKGNKYSIIKKINYLPAEPIAFERIKDKVAGDYKHYLQQERLRTWLDSLYETYHVKVNEKALEHAFAS